MGLSLKELVARSPLSSVAVAAREWLHVVELAARGDEDVGFASNDQIASALLTRLCPAGGVFLDIGAHLGTIVESVLRRHDGITVIAVEAVDTKAEFVRQRFPDVEVHHCAAGERAGEATFFVDVERSAYSSLGKPSPEETREVREVRVPVRALDDLIAQPTVDFIKIDVEGAELGVLRGAKHIIERDRPPIMFESGPTGDNGLHYTKEALWQWFEDEDYGVYVPNRVGHSGPGLSQEGFLESHLHPRRTTNYFAIPHEQREALRLRAREVLGLHDPDRDPS